MTYKYVSCIVLASYAYELRLSKVIPGGHDKTLRSRGAVVCRTIALMSSILPDESLEEMVEIFQSLPPKSAGSIIGSFGSTSIC